MNNQGADEEREEELQNEGQDESQESEALKTKPDTEESLKEELVKVKRELEELKSYRQQPQPQPQPQPSQQQYQFRFKATPEMVESFLTEPQKAAAILDGLYQSALQEMAQLVVPYIEERVRPLQQQYAQSQVEVLTNQFLRRHKDMEPYLEEARQVANAILVNPQRQYKDLNEFFDDVAAQTKEVVKRWQERLNVRGPNEAPPAGSKASSGSVRAATADENEMDVIKSIIGG